MGSISYKYKIFFGFVLITTIIEATVISFDINKAYQIRKNFLEQRSQILIQTYSQTLKIPCWNLDLDTSKSILQSSLVDPDIIKAKLTYQDNIASPQLVTKNNIDLMSLKNSTDFLEVQQNITSPVDDSIIASLHLTFSKQRLQLFLSERFNEGLMQALVLLLFNFNIMIN